MSHSKKDRTFPLKTLPTDAALARMIATALQRDYSDTPSPIKHVGMRTGIHLRAIKNWFQGYHSPSVRHMIALARISPGVFRVFLEQVGDAEILAAFDNRSARGNVPINVPIKNMPPNHNTRQQWFLKRLRHGKKATARDIQAHARVSLKTARRDIADLVAQGIIRFSGSKKTGFYCLS